MEEKGIMSKFHFNYKMSKDKNKLIGYKYSLELILDSLERRYSTCYYLSKISNLECYN